MALIIFTDTLTYIVGQSLVFLPSMVIYAKICPKHIEATTFALLTGVGNFRFSISSYVGAYVNDSFIGVTETNLKDYWVLVLISFLCSFLPRLLIWMIPTRKQIDQLQESMKDKGAKTDDDAGEKSNKGFKVGEKKDQ